MNNTPSPIITEITDRLDRYLGIDIDRKIKNIPELLSQHNGAFQQNEKQQLENALLGAMNRDPFGINIADTLHFLIIARIMEIRLMITAKNIWRAILKLDERTDESEIHRLFTEAKWHNQGIDSRIMPEDILNEHLKSREFGNEYVQPLTNLFSITNTSSLQPAADYGMIRYATPTRVTRLRALGLKVDFMDLTTRQEPEPLSPEEEAEVAADREEWIAFLKNFTGTGLPIFHSKRKIGRAHV